MFATISVLLGLLAMFSNGIAYTNHFSTIFRTARYAEMGVTIFSEDADGKDPLPKYLSQATISFLDKDSSSRPFRSNNIDMRNINVGSRLLAV